MRGTYGRTHLVGGLLVCAVAAAIAAGVGCSTSATTKPRGTTGAAGTGAAGTSSSGGAGTSSTGAAGDSSAAAGTSGGEAGTTAAAGTSGGGAGTTAAAGTTGGGAGTTGAAGDSSAAGTVGAAGTTAVDNTPTTPLPITVTAVWFPQGYYGDPYTQSLFASTDATMVPITMTKSTTGPCASRVAGPVGDCYQVVYNPQMADASVPYAGVAFLTDAGGVKNWDMPLTAPRPAQGATKVTLVAAGAVGGEAVSFKVGVQADSISATASPTLTTSWQPVTLSFAGGTYDHVISGFGWGSTSASKITFYFDNVVFGQ